MKKILNEIRIYSIKEVAIVSFVIATMGDRVVSFSPVKRVLTYSPTEAVTEVGKSKKKRSVIMPDDVPNSAMSDVVPLMDVTSKKGKSTLVKKIKELKLKKKLQKRKNRRKKKTTMMLSPIQGKPKRTLIKKTRERLFLSKSGIKNEF